MKPEVARKVWTLLTTAERRSAIGLLGLMLIGMVLETLGVGLVLPVIALLMQGDFISGYPAFQPMLEAMGNPSHINLVICGMLILLGLYLLKALFLVLLAWKQARFTFRFQAQLSLRLFAVYLHQPYMFHLQRNSAQLIQNIIGEVSLFTNKAIMAALLLFAEVLVLFGVFGLLIFIEPLGALIAGVLLGTAAFGFHHITRGRISRWGKARQLHDGLRIQHLQQGLGGAKDVKLLGREAEFLERYRSHNDQSAHVEQRQFTLQQLPRLWLEVLSVGGLVILVISMLMQGRPLEAILPTLGVFAAAAFRLIPSVNRILGAVQSIRYGLPVIDVLHKEINLVTEDLAGANRTVTPFRAMLELDHITYTYLTEVEHALSDISIAIKRGESVGFIGVSGAGKSTLVNILLGLLTPDAGEVRVDGENIQVNLRNWQDQIGYVPQSIFLTDDTLRRNVAFGLSGEQIDDTALQRAIEAAQLEEFVAGLPHGLETVVGERGIRVSGGQRQRIGIARALYHDPAVLMLDEATSSLDIATEYGVMQAVRTLHGAKTIIIVAHRLSTVEHCDRLYRLEQGRMVEEGRTADILGPKGKGA
jgi:ABC-type multidrug transport system fused ATPase/permease subunit